MGVQNDIKVAKPTHIHFLPLYYYCNNVVNYGELVTRSIHGGGLDKLHCLVITVTLTDRSLKEYTLCARYDQCPCYICLHCAFIN